MAEESATENVRSVTERMLMLRDSIHQSNDALGKTQGLLARLVGSMTIAPVVQDVLKAIVVSTDRGQRAIALWADAKRGIVDVHAEIMSSWAKLYETEKLTERKAFRDRISHLRHIRSIQSAFQRAGPSWLLASLSAIGATVRLYHLSQGIQQNLIEANSSLSHRHKLLGDTLKTVAATGVSLEHSTAAAAALVHYGMDNEKSWSANLKLVSQLERGIGLSVQLAAKLAAIAENQLHIGFQRVADVVSALVNYTALSADEAGRLAENISQVIGSLRPGLAGDTAGVIRVVGEYESAFKRMGGSTGQVTELLNRLTTIQGMPAAGLIGIYNPEFAANAQSVESTLKALGRTVRQFTEGMEGYQRQAQLEILAQQFGVSARELNRLMLVESAVAKERSREMQTQERFREQMAASGQSLARIGNALTASIQIAVLPLIEATNTILGVVADSLVGLNKVLMESEYGVSALRLALIGLFATTLARFTPVLKLLTGAGWTGLAARLLPGTAAATGGAALPVILLVTAVGSLVLILKEYFDWLKIDTERKNAVEYQKQLRQQMDATRLQVLQQGVIQGKDQLVNRALFGVSATDRGMIGDMVRDQQISWEQAVEKVFKEHIQPVAALRSAAQLAQASALDTEVSPEIKAFNDFVRQLKAQADESAKDRRIQEEKKASQRETENRRTILRESTKPPVPSFGVGFGGMTFRTP